MKTILPHKLIITQDGNGNINQAILQYKTNNDGIIGANVNSVSVLNALQPEAKDIMALAIASAKKSEGIQ